VKSRMSSVSRCRYTVVSSAPVGPLRTHAGLTTAGRCTPLRQYEAVVAPHRQEEPGTGVPAGVAERDASAQAPAHRRREGRRKWTVSAADVRIDSVK
jgi:hypothetical protein